MELRRERLSSAHFGDERDISIVLPDAYSGRRRYPVLYLHDGSNDWFKRGRLTEAVRQAAVDDFIIVMPEPRDRTREYKLSRRHLAFVVDELVPWVDANLRTRATPAGRVVHGVSLGGLTAVALGLRHPSVFGFASAQGGAFWYRGIVREAARSKGCPTQFHLACGRGDGNLSDNRALAAALSDAGLLHTYVEVPGRHSWACWRRCLPDLLVACFRPRRTRGPICS